MDCTWWYDVLDAVGAGEEQGHPVMHWVDAQQGAPDPSLTRGVAVLVQNASSVRGAIECRPMWRAGYTASRVGK